MTPNLHPVFVHFTVALFSISSLLYLSVYLIKFSNNDLIKLSIELEITARWCLWIASFTPRTLEL